MSEYTEYFVIPTSTVEMVRDRLKANRVRAAIHVDEAEQALWEALPQNRRFAVVYTLDATLEELGRLFPRVLWLLVDEDPARWRMNVWVEGRTACFLFSDVRWGDFSEEGDEALIAASRSPQPADVALLAQFFEVPRDELAPHLRMGGLHEFVEATGMPLLIPTSQRCLEWFLEQGRLDKEVVISYDELD